MSRSLNRRTFLKSAAATVPFGLLGATPHAVSAAISKPPTTPRDYAPRFFHAAEWSLLKAVVDRLIPADELGPGALAAGVPEYIDRQMELPYGHGGLWYMQGPFEPDADSLFGQQSSMTPRDIYRLGLAAFQQACQQREAKGFEQLSASAQDACLLALEQGQLELAGISAQPLFALMLAHTREGFFADPVHGGNQHLIGWTFAGFPGARADFMDWVDFPNQAYPLGPIAINGERA